MSRSNGVEKKGLLWWSGQLWNGLLWNNLLWRLPIIKSKSLGKLGPGYGYGAGCGAGLGIGFFGGTGLGVGFPGLHFGLGVGAGCGIGLGFGYGVGRGIAYDETKRYSNVGKVFHGQGDLPSQEDIDALVDQFAEKTKNFLSATLKEVNKRTRR